jgi:hypothetical protein
MKRGLREEHQIRLGALIEEAERRASGTAEPAPTKRTRSGKRTVHLSKQESFDRLEPFLEEAVAGAPDEWLARQAGVSLDSVLWWRREKGVQRKRGPLRSVEKQMWAAGFGLAYDPQMHAATSDFGGLWEAPEYVLRTPIRYKEFCRHLYAAHAQVGTGPELLSLAFGIRPRDVELAISVWGRHLREINQPCAACPELVDPQYGKYCSTRCAEKKK